MIDTYTKVILSVIALAMVIQLVRSEVSVSQFRQTCGSASEPCYVKFSVLDKPCGQAVDRPCFVTPVPGGVTGSTPEPRKD